MTKKVFGYLHTHWDREWYKTYEEFRLRLCSVMDDIFYKLDNKEINSFYLDGQVVALNDYLEIYPHKFEYVRNLIKNKKLFVGPFYDLADEFLVNGESLARNLLIGISEAKKLGADEKDFVGYLPDAFGHNAWMPMLFSQTNIKNAIVWRGVSLQKQEITWFSPDGASIKTIFLPLGYFQDFLHKKSYKKNLQKLLVDLEKYTDSNTPVLLPIGGDHLACADNIKAKIKNFNRNNNDFNISIINLPEFFEKINDNSSAQEVQGELRDNSKTYILMGTASSRIDIKQLNQKAQWMLGKITEPLCALFSDNIGNKKPCLDYAWKVLIKNHAHDSICGCSLDAVHSENILRYNKVFQLCGALNNSFIAKYSEFISKDELGILNLSNFDFSGVFSFRSDKKLPLVRVGKKKAFPVEISQDLYQAPVQEHYHYYYEYLAQVDKIKGCSFSISKPQLPQKTNLFVSERFIENEVLFVSINPDGSFNLKNKITNKELSNLFRITDEADVGDSYNFSCILSDIPILAKFVGSKIIEDNSLRKILRLKYEMQIPSHAISDDLRSKKTLKHVFNVDLILCNNSKRLDIKINYENLSKDHILKLQFSLPKDITDVLSEDAFGVTNRKFVPNYNYKDEIPLPKYKELNVNTGVFQRFVMSQGLCVLTKGLQEYEVDGNSLNITLLRAFGVISKKTLLTRTAAAGPPLPTPEGQMLGKQSAEISIMLESDVAQVFKEADFFYNSLVIIDGKANKTKIKSKQLLNVSENLYLQSLKVAEDGCGLIAKIFNFTNKKQAFICRKDIYQTNILEEKLSTENLKSATIEFAPNELKVFRIL